jgi:hypothetical protein
MPLFYPNLFVTTQVRNRSLSVASMDAASAAINVLLTYCIERGIDLESRIRGRRFFNPAELDAIRDECQKRRSKHGGVAVVPFRGRNAKQRVGAGSEYTRLTHVANYLRWLSHTMLGSTVDEATARQIDLIHRGLIGLGVNRERSADPRLMDRVQDKPIGATVQHLRVGGVETLLMPVPPLEEQRRIVAKLDELMALCDQLEASLTTGEAARSQLLDALLHEALVPAPAASSEHPRAAVSGYVVSRLASKRNFGCTAHMKHLYLAESRLGLKLGGRYARQAAGPLDTDIYELEKQAEAAGWYTHSVQVLPSGKDKVSYVPGKALKALAEEGAAVLGPSREEMDRLIDLMGGLKTEQVEIIATLFAAWNDALLDGQVPDDDWIVKEVREHWHVSKQRFAPADLLKWLEWMRQHDVVPLGHPPRTMQQTAMEF